MGVELRKRWWFWALVAVAVLPAIYVADAVRMLLTRLPPVACAERVRSLDADDQWPILLEPDPGHPPLSAKPSDVRPKPFSRGPVIQLRHDGVFIDNFQVVAIEGELNAEDRKAILDVLQEKQRMLDQHALLGGTILRTVNVATDQDVRWDDVVAAVRIAEQARFEAADFLFERPSPEPAHSVVNDSIVAMMAPTSIDQFLMDRWYQARMAVFRRLIPGCSGPGVIARLMNPEAKYEELRLDGMLQACDCSVDFDLMRLFLHRLGPSSRWAHQYVGGTAKLRGEHPREIAFPANARWDDIAAELIEAIREPTPVRLVTLPRERAAPVGSANPVLTP